MGVMLWDSSISIIGLQLFSVRLVLPMKALEVNNAVALSEGACPTSLLFKGNERSATYNMLISLTEGIYHCISPACIRPSLLLSRFLRNGVKQAYVALKLELPRT